MKAILALEDGSMFEGQGFGAKASACGEVCFNTSMTGYQEILTDPSYKGQIVAMTYPLIGNYGVNSQDIESWRPHVAGFVVRELSPIVSNWRADFSLAEYLEKNGIPGIQDIDTRSLTKRLRVGGAMKAFISTKEISDADAVKRAKEWPGIVGVDYVKEVTHREPFLWDVEDKELTDSGIPIFGICLGHQILGQAFGGKTFKLKFGHRGANQPVKDLETGKVEITSQNHGFAVDAKSLPRDVEVNRINLNDNTVEGMRHKKKPIFCVQYHPEASPGPHDSTILFDEFRKLIEKR